MVRLTYLETWYNKVKQKSANIRVVAFTSLRNVPTIPGKPVNVEGHILNSCAEPRRVIDSPL